MIKRKYKRRKKWQIKSSKLEKRFAKYLREWGIKYKTQFYLKGKYYDFYLPDYKLLIETDGDWFHTNPKKFKKMNLMQLKNKRNDLYKDGLAKSSGYNMLRLWEHDINNNLNTVKYKLFNKIKLIKENS